MKFVVCFCAVLVISLVSPTFTQEIGFQGDTSIHPREQNAQNRKPYFVPGKCKDNEYLYPGDQNDDWICDCAPGYLYHPENDECYLAFRQGPCPKGSMLVLGNNRVIPECYKNTCDDGSVIIKGKCEKFGESDVCQPKVMKMLGVDPSTFRVTCLDKPVFVSVDKRFGGDSDPEPIVTTPDPPKCAKGSKRFINGKCR